MPWLEENRCLRRRWLGQRRVGTLSDYYEISEKGYVGKVESLGQDMGGAVSQKKWAGDLNPKDSS